MRKEIKPITLRTEDGKEYTLEFNRESIRFAESRGFNINDMWAFPMTKIPEIFFYAFRMHHRNLSREKTDKILEDMGGLSGDILERLGELYNVPFETLLPDDDEPKNSKVTVEM